MRPTGIEPALREELDPKSSASANSATGADATAKVVFFLRTHKKSGKIYGVLLFPSFRLLLLCISDGSALIPFQAVGKHHCQSKLMRVVLLITYFFLP